MPAPGRRPPSPQGAGETGNAPLEAGVDTRHTAGRGYDPKTGHVATRLASASAGLGYDPVTQTVTADVEGIEGSWGQLGGYKDSIPDALGTGAQRELGHADGGRLDPHVQVGRAEARPKQGETKEGAGKGK